MRFVLFLVIALMGLSQGLCQILYPEDVKITLNDALPIALEEARKQFPDLDGYIFYSISPRALKGDPKGMFWQFDWQEKDSPHDKRLIVRVYMKDRSTFAERSKLGTYQKEHYKHLEP